LETIELEGLNRLFEARGPRPPATPIVIVSIDEDSFDELDLPWPFPRALHGRLLDVVSEAGAVAIGLDIMFSEPSAHGPADDEALAGAVARAGTVVLAAALTVTTEGFYTKIDPNLPLPVIRRGAAGVAPVNLDVDADGYVRRAPLQHLVGDQPMSSFDARLHAMAAAAGIPARPLPETDEVLINYAGGRRTFPWVPYHRVVGGEVSPEIFRGKVVLVGGTSPVLQDVYSTPFARRRSMPGVEIHANALETLLRGTPIRHMPPWLGPLLAGAAVVATGALVARLRALRACLAVAVLLAALIGGSVVAFAWLDTWFRTVTIAIALVVGYLGAVTESFIREQRTRRRLSQFFSPAVLNEVVRHKEGVVLGTSRRMLTVLFADIRGFTSMSEKLGPEHVVEMLGEYLTEMTEVVFRHGGTVDKYVGDTIMALYNAPLDDPDHAANAVRTALELQERTLAIAARWESRLGTRIRNGVGINTGEAVVGTMGSRQRLEYTAIGDTVNLASRLENLT
ncbi:MAG: CHASE2 domain-containing protein, partial [Candidatus Rokuibacteriota bacterium]